MGASGVAIYFGEAFPGIELAAIEAEKTTSDKDRYV
jgi:hypothetical protein